MDKTTKDQLNESGVGNTWVNMLLMVLMIVVICVIGINIENNRESQVGTVSYVTQLEWLAGSKGYTTEDKVTYKERQQLETEEGRYKEVMKYLEGVEVSESEFKEIKEIESNFQKIVNVNDIGKNDYDSLSNILIAIVFCIFMFLLTTYALIH